MDLLFQEDPRLLLSLNIVLQPRLPSVRSRPWMLWILFLLVPFSIASTGILAGIAILSSRTILTSDMVLGWVALIAVCSAIDAYLGMLLIRTFRSEGRTLQLPQQVPLRTRRRLSNVVILLALAVIGLGFATVLGSEELKIQLIWVGAGVLLIVGSVPLLGSLVGLIIRRRRH